MYVQAYRGDYDRRRFFQWKVFHSAVSLHLRSLCYHSFHVSPLLVLSQQPEKLFLCSFICFVLFCFSKHAVLRILIQHQNPASHVKRSESALREAMRELPSICSIHVHSGISKNIPSESKCGSIILSIRPS